MSTRHDLLYGIAVRLKGISNKLGQSDDREYYEGDPDIIYWDTDFTDAGFDFHFNGMDGSTYIGFFKVAKEVDMNGAYASIASSDIVAQIDKFRIAATKLVEKFPEFAEALEAEPNFLVESIYS